MTYFTLLKGFIGTAVLYLPREVYLGGWLTTIVFLFFSLVLTFVSALRLLDAQKASKARSYMEIGMKAYGRLGKNLVGSFLIITQAGFAVAMFFFLISQVKEVLSNYDVEVGYWTMGFIYFLIMSPLGWIKDLAKFSKFHLAADFIILVTILTVVAFATQNVEENGWGE